MANNTVYCTCVVNDKYSFPFKGISESVISTDPLIKRAYLNISPMSTAEKNTIESEIAKELWALVGKENGVKTIECKNPAGSVIFSSKEFSYLSNVEFQYNMNEDFWTFSVSFLTKKAN